MTDAPDATLREQLRAALLTEGVRPEDVDGIVSVALHMVEPTALAAEVDALHMVEPTALAAEVDAFHAEGDLRDRLAKALRGKYDSTDSRPSYRAADAVLPVVQAALAEQTQRAEKAEAEAKRLREHILDIDAHATPYEDLPDDPGYVGVYLLTSGALHRALGQVGHSAPKCRDATRVAELTEELEEAEAAVRQVRDVVAWLRSAEDEMSAIADRIDAALGQPDDALPKPCPLGLRLHTPHTWTDGGPIRDCPGITDQPEASSDG